MKKVEAWMDGMDFEHELTDKSEYKCLCEIYQDEETCRRHQNENVEPKRLYVFDADEYDKQPETDAASDAGQEILQIQKDVQKLRGIIVDARACGSLNLDKIQFDLIMKLGLCERAMKGLQETGLSDFQVGTYYLHDNRPGGPYGKPYCELKEDDDFEE